MTPLFRCPWCIHVERGMKAPPLMRKHILERHRMLLIRGLGIVWTFSTRHPSDPSRKGLTAVHELNPGVSGEGDS